MKRNIIILILCYIATALVTVRCVKASNPPVDELLSEFLPTRASAPLESTIWEHKTGEQYDKYLLFRGGEMSLFYGLVEGDELQRWSEFYSSGYVYDGGIVYTFISYPQWGKDEYAHNAYIVEVGNGHTMRVNGVDDYTYFSPYTEDIEGQWMLIIAEPAPWD